MGVFSSLYRYITTLGGLLSGDVDSKTDELLSTPSGIKATYDQTREKWTKQYSEVRHAIAQLMMVLEQKRKQVEQLSKEASEVKVKMSGAVEKFKSTKDPKYQTAFNDLFARDKEITTEQESLNTEITELDRKVERYKEKLNEMQKRIADLKKEEAAAIADIVSSKQIINLNDRLNNLSTDLDDKNLEAISDRRQNLVAQAKLSGELASGVETPSLDEELLSAGKNTEADALFAAMMAEDGQTDAAESEQVTEAEQQREI